MASGTCNYVAGRFWEFVFLPMQTDIGPHLSSSTLYFVSDVHLGVGDPETEREKQALLLELLSHVQEEATALYIVGDLFDFWYEYKHVVPRGYHNILSRLEQLVSSGIPVTYLAGNHDFAIGDSFMIDLGVRIEHNDFEALHDDRKFYMFHGDGLTNRDAGYRILKRVLRNSFSRWLFRLIHPDMGFALARSVSHKSRGYTSSKKYGELDGQREEAERRIKAGADFVIMGHSHRPVLENIGSGVYVNLGDWIKHRTFAIYKDSSIHLYEFQDREPRQIL
jgi:UDP-2,3-diacylglucosamine hydrolase